MILARIATLTGFFYAACIASTPPPYALEKRILDRIFALSLNEDEIGRIAIDVLEKVALGRLSNIGPQTEARIGLVGGMLRRPEYGSATVRAHAFRKIGESSSPEALGFLTRVQQADVGPDSSQEIWPAVQIALTNARLSKIDDPRVKAEFLERTLTEEKVHYGGGELAHWVVDKLCDSGATTSLVIIRQSIRSRISGPRGESEIRFCEARIEVVSRSPDRMKALSSVLRVDGDAEEMLLRWAIYQLEEMHSPAADAELDRFATEIGKLPVSSQRQRLEILKKRIESGLRER
ncbi:MAG: hypothetical protein IT165_27160 [Bryobacterales bacterium]|nr:hypothetical protein [Bryobacterales bacterium]